MHAPTTAFIQRWQGVTGSERANYQLFISDLCVLLGVATPDPAHEDTRDNAYVFERRVTFAHGDGSASHGFIDCYKRAAFVLEAKKVKAGAHTKGFDEALLRARAQGEGYARALPAAEGRPPFVVVVDVGHVIELYAEFTRSGATYTPFPDARSHRIRLADLHDAKLRDRLRLLWQDPMALDPSRASAKVTREVAVQLATVARSLEAAGHAPQRVAAFLTRCLFSMFAEDVELLPRTPQGEGAFVHLLKQYRDDPATLQRMLRALWADMDRGGFSAALAKDVLRFNGKLFKGSAADGYVLPLKRDQIDGLLAAANANWREVEPAIFGTLLERALDPAERHALGAHYTPRAYVERLVLPTVVEPLRADWANAQAAALLLATEANTLEGKKREDKLVEARAEVRRFHHQLCTVRVLDPACGSGNFLYVTLEHLKRLEGEVLDQLDLLGETQSRLGLQGETVTLQQLRGIEINERAAALAELVLWIGYLQWHIRTFGHASVAEPVIHDYGNIEHRDAVLAYDDMVPMRDDAGRIVTRWDATTFKRHPVTGEQVPDEAAQVPQWRYVNARQAEWPAADFIVGNPPFIGNKRMRDALGDGYVEALRGAYHDVPDSADYVMYWWDRAAAEVRCQRAFRFGLITTNSITMPFNRRIVERHLSESPPLGLVFAIPDHPWVDGGGGAAVRVAMTVGQRDALVGELGFECHEDVVGVSEPPSLNRITGLVHGDLTIGARTQSMQQLLANRGIVFQGVIPIGDGFKLRPPDLVELQISHHQLPDALKPYVIGLDIVRTREDKWLIDFAGLSLDEARSRYPALFQRVLDRVKPVRDLNRERSRRERWWLFARSNEEMRAAKAGLTRFIATPDTSRHKPFVFMEGRVLPDAQVYCIASSDAFVLGVLSSTAHQSWLTRVAPRLGVGNDLRWKPAAVWSTFPFPHDDTGLTPTLTERIRQLAEQIDAHRKARQAAHEGVTLTGLYNVLAKLRSGEALTVKDKLLHEQGLVGVLRSLHDDLDAAVLAAYGWGDLQAALADHTPAAAAARATAVDALLERLVALNAQRAAEEAAGTVRWLRPEFQQPSAQAGAAVGGTQAGLDIEPEAAEPGDGASAVAPPAAPVTKRPWPTGLPEQIKAVAELLSAHPLPLSAPDIEARFTARGRWRERLPTILDTLEALGRARRVEGDAVRWQAG